MAGTDENSITAADLRLACNELAFVTKLVGSEERALKVMDSLLDDLAKGFIRWDCDSLRVCPKTSGGITKFSEHEAD